MVNTPARILSSVFRRIELTREIQHTGANIKNLGLRTGDEHFEGPNGNFNFCNLTLC